LSIKPIQCDFCSIRKQTLKITSSIVSNNDTTFVLSTAPTPCALLTHLGVYQDDPTALHLHLAMTNQTKLHLMTVVPTTIIPSNIIT